MSVNKINIYHKNCIEKDSYLIPWQRLRYCLPIKAGNNQKLGYYDGKHNPGLSPESFAVTK